jgi:nicotinamidase-related amidase
MIRTIFLLAYLFTINHNAIASTSALLLLDMEKYFIIEYEGSEDLVQRNKEKLQALIKEQIFLIRLAKKNNIPILATLYGTWGKVLPSLQKELNGYNKLTIVRKENNNLFANEPGNEEHREQALNFLRKYSVSSLVVIGANGGACVKSTIVGALEHSYEIKAYPKGIIDFNHSEYLYPYYLNDFAKIDGEKLLDLSPMPFEELDDAIFIEKLFTN